MEINRESCKILDNALSVLMQSRDGVNWDKWLELCGADESLAVQFANIAEADGFINVTRMAEGILYLSSRDQLSIKLANGGYRKGIEESEKDTIIKDLQIENLRLSSSDYKQRRWKNINATIASLAGLVAIAEGVALFFRCFG